MLLKIVRMKFLLADITQHSNKVNASIYFKRRRELTTKYYDPRMQEIN